MEDETQFLYKEPREKNVFVHESTESREEETKMDRTSFDTNLYPSSYIYIYIYIM